MQRDLHGSGVDDLYGYLLFPFYSLFLQFCQFTFSEEIEDEEIEESASQEPIYESDDAVISSQLVDVKEVPKMSWLLQVVLTNLRVNVYGPTVINFDNNFLLTATIIEQHNSPLQSVTMVRIESKICLNN